MAAAAKHSPTFGRLQTLLEKCELQLRSGAVSAATLHMIEDAEQAIAECLQSLAAHARSQRELRVSAARRKQSASRISVRNLMLPRAARQPFDRRGWIFELKYDGVRALAIRGTNGARLLSRSGVNLAPAFPEIVESLLKLPEVVLDGELVVLDTEGKADFDALQTRSLARSASAAKRAMSAGIADFLAFDVLTVRAEDLRALPLLRRKRVLQQTLEGFQRIRPMQYVHEHGKRLFAAARDLEIGAIVAKRADAPYTAGKSRDWLAIRQPAPAAKPHAAATTRRGRP